MLFHDFHSPTQVLPPTLRDLGPHSLPHGGGYVIPRIVITIIIIIIIMTTILLPLPMKRRPRRTVMPFALGLVALLPPAIAAGVATSFESKMEYNQDLLLAFLFLLIACIAVNKLRKVFFQEGAEVRRI